MKPESLPRPPIPRRIHAPAALGLAATLALAGCGSQEPPPEPEETPHGYVEGAEETDGTQVRLLVIEADTGDAVLFDPETEEGADVDLPGGPVDGVATDGRHGYVSDAEGVTILDTGVWTVDHGDHNHYYRAPTEVVGSIDGGTDPQASGTVSATVLTTNQGTQVLDRGALDDGEVTPADAPAADAVLPHNDWFLAVGGAAADAVQIFDREDTETGDEVTETCVDPAAATTTRRGAVLACADDTLVLDDDGDAPTITAVANPEEFDGAAPPAFHHRDFTPLLGALADGNPWLLDLDAEEWRELDADSAVAVQATGEDSPVLTLSEDGTLASHAPESGEELASTDLIDSVDADAPPPLITADAHRAYVTDPEALQVHEIDYADDLRVARTFDLDIRPDHLVQTGW